MLGSAAMISIQPSRVIVIPGQNVSVNMSASNLTELWYALVRSASSRGENMLNSIQYVVAAFAFSVAGYAATISVQPVASTIAVGNTIAVNIDVTNATDLYAYQFDVLFDPTVASALLVTEGGLFFSGGGTTFFIPGAISNTLGSVTFTANALVGAIPGIDGSGSLATIRFRGLSAGVSNLALSNVVLLNSAFGNISATTATGSLSVTNSSAVPEPASGLLLGPGLALGWLFRRQTKSKLIDR